MNKYAWVTLLSTYDYLEAVLVLNRSLKKVSSKFSFIAACTPNIIQNKEIVKILKEEKIIIENIPWLEYNYQTKKDLSFYGIDSIFNVGAKIEIFGLKQYEKLIYLDADSFVVKNIDSLFKKKDGSSLIDNNNKCFCALFVFSPKNHPLDFYKSILTNEVCNDGTLMEKLWWHVCDNKKYHIKNLFFYRSSYEKTFRNIKAYHLQDRYLKYWKMKFLPNTPLANLYKTYLFPIRKQYEEQLKKIYASEKSLFKNK